MKKIKFNYTYILLLVLVIISSCSSDDSVVPVTTTDIVQTELVGTLTLGQDLVASEETIDYSFTVPQSFNSDAVVEVTFTNPSDFSQTVSKANLPAGTTSGTGTMTFGEIDMTNGELNGSSFGTVKLTGIDLADSAEDIYGLTSDTVPVNLVDRIPVTQDGIISILMDWENPSGNDLDAFLFFGATYTGLSGATGSRYEQLNMPTTFPDGAYRIAVNPFSTVAGLTSIPLKFYFRTPDGNLQIVNADLTGFDASLIYFVLDFTKTTDANGNVSVTVS